MKMSIDCREATSNDYNFFKKMLYDALYVPNGAEPFDISIIDLPDISRYVDNWGKVGDFGLILEKEGTPIGAIWGRLFNGYGFVDVETPEISMAIQEKYRVKGLGRQLLSIFIQIAKEKGYNALSLSVDKRNRAFDLYKRLDFKVVEETKTSCIMKKDL
jgi:GNAT superfamily N-acetyltransferase